MRQFKVDAVSHDVDWLFHSHVLCHINRIKHLYQTVNSVVVSRIRCRKCFIAAILLLSACESKWRRCRMSSFHSGSEQMCLHQCVLALSYRVRVLLLLWSSCLPVWVSLVLSLVSTRLCCLPAPTQWVRFKRLSSCIWWEHLSSPLQPQHNAHPPHPVLFHLTFTSPLTSPPPTSKCGLS